MLHERNVLAQRMRDPRAPGPSLPGLGPRVVVTSCQGAGPRCELAGSLLAFQEIKSVDDFFYLFKKCSSTSIPKFAMDASAEKCGSPLVGLLPDSS